jgi:YidC/Oxa1 family membrane protein insertase
LKHETKIKLLGGLGLLVGALVLSGCTANFCSSLDEANIAYPYEQGVTVYCDQANIPTEYQALAKKVWDDNPNVYYYVPVNTSGYYAANKATYLTNTIIANAVSSNYLIPSQNYFISFDKILLDNAIDAAKASTTFKLADGRSVTGHTDLKASDINPFKSSTNPVLAQDCVGNESGVEANYNSILRSFGYLKFYGDDAKTWTNWDAWNLQIATTLNKNECPNADFTTLYKSNMNSKISAARTCIATVEDNYGHFGNSSNWEVSITAKSWGDSWKKGFLEGLIIYPVSWMIDTFARSMDPNLTGVGQIWAIVLVTLIVRAFVLLLTFKSTMDQQKTQALQPQLAKLQAKYPNSNTNKAEAARLSQEQMALYKRNKVNPLSMFLAMLVQFPVFIAVWGALQGSAVLSSGEVLNLRLSDTIQSVLTNVSGTWYYNTNGWWTAFILFLLMSVFQWLAMMLPQWMTKKRTKNQAHTTTNPAQDKNTNTMKWVSYGMLIFTIIMGFALPAAMGVYWGIGAVISMVQTLVTQMIMAKKQDKEKRL